jgi:hypothetical protein
LESGNPDLCSMWHLSCSVLTCCYLLQADAFRDENSKRRTLEKQLDSLCQQVGWCCAMPCFDVLGVLVWCYAHHALLAYQCQPVRAMSVSATAQRLVSCPHVARMPQSVSPAVAATVSTSAAAPAMPSCCRRCCCR